MSARVVFMGTPRSALPTLEMLAETHEVALVVTQPDRPFGRSGKPKPPPVKERAESLGLQVTQPSDRDELRDALASSGPFDLGAVVAYGRILKPEVLSLPEHGLLNVHFSLLPRWRGAAPVARALMAGDAMTGVTIIQLDEGLDTGPVLTAQAVDVLEGENAGRLTDRLAVIGGRLLTACIPSYLSGDLVPVPQSDEGATYAGKLVSGDRPIDIGFEPAQVVAHVRGLAPDPGATLAIDGEPHQVLEASRSEVDVASGSWEIVSGSPVFGVSGGSVEIELIKPPGRNLQSGADWARGLRRDHGTVG